LAEALPGAVTVHFDLHPVEMPPDLSGWLADGADFNEWKTQELEAELAAVCPVSEMVVFEAPLGRRHRGSGAYIDFLVFIELPLEIALARFVKRELEGDASRLVPYIEAYEPLAREVYREQLRQVMPDADLVLDGRQPVDVNIGLLLEALSQR
jgi:uridine kinase